MKRDPLFPELTNINDQKKTTLSSADIVEIAQKIRQQPQNKQLGDILGELFLKDYFSEDQHFSILKLQKSAQKGDHSPAQKVILINGFLTNKAQIFADWLKAYQDIPDNVELYGLTWDSKEPGDFLKNFIAPPPTAASILRQNIWGKLAYGVVANPWHASMTKAEKAGELLGKILAQTHEHYSLAGHSLGCRVIYYTAKSLLSNTLSRLENLYLLGGAVGNQAEDWERVADHIQGSIYNCYSKNDDVLRYGYQGANLGLSTPIGYMPIDTTHPKIHNIDCTDLIAGHDQWKIAYPAIYRRIKNR